MNNRKEIRDAIAARLTGLTLNSESVPVFNQRQLPPKERPSVNIFTDGGTSEKSDDEGTNRRIERVMIEFYVDGLEKHEITDSGVLSVNDQLESLIVQFEDEFHNDYESLGNIIHRLNYVSTDLNSYTDGNKIIAEGILEYAAMVNEELGTTL